MTNPSAVLTERRYIVAFVLVTSLFFLWALGVNLNDILIPHLKKAFHLTDFQSSLIQSAFFGGYFLAALPAGWLMERIGYRKGILIGLLTCAFGAFLFIPAASIGLYGFFLFALFVMACGQGILEVAANPYVTILGPPESSERRLNLAQSFNAVGAVVTPIIGRAFILSGIEYSAVQLSAMTPEQSAAYSALEASRVRGPYLAITALFLFVAALLYLAHLPEVREASGEGLSGLEAAPMSRWEIWRYKHLVKGVTAQFFYVGAQIGVTSFVIRFTQHTLPGTPEKVAANFLKWHLIGFMVGRFTGSAMMKRIAPPRLLGIFAVCALLSTATAIVGTGEASVWAVVVLGFFDSIMFPTIFALSVKNLGVYTKLGSALLVMSIIGGAIVPAIMGYMSDVSSIQKAFVVPLICYAYVLYFALRGYKPVVATTPD
ncbi:MAG TPA: L-fucose:H+ symporter permease [Candidatus Udaeobacter sp.]|jgi:MFS transporter, FHS family, L-fucose permease|nr:L-fucose:H+ symporter permease [Candidatus Udaeobacter sp.]